MHISKKYRTFAQTFLLPMNQDYKMYVRKASAGSGKTYTLAAHYIALLFHGESFQSILAVTFTNKATAEMKERILGYLYAIGHDTAKTSTQRFLKRVRVITEELGYDSTPLTDAFCSLKALEQHALILSHYDEMRVQTIDAFLQSLLAGMVQQLGGAVGYQVELDIKRVVSDAVDQLLTEGAKDPQVRESLANYMNERLEQEKNWDVRKGLNEIGLELYKELLQQHRSELLFDKVLLSAFYKKLDWHQYVPIDRIKSALNQASRWNPSDFSYGQTDVVDKICLFSNQLSDQIDSPGKAFQIFSSRLLKGMGITIDDSGVEHIDGEIKAYKGGESPQSIQSEILQLLRYSNECRHFYIREHWRTRYINDIVLMGALQKNISEHLAVTNTRLLADTANLLAEALKGGDADFVLEKAGIRYRHIMLDEFQDTSALQWANFEKLLHEILSSYAGSTLIVGDIKQSIYRWRNGDWTIMRDLQSNWSDHYNTQTPQLTCNYRSEREVVKFNLDTMRSLVSHEAEDIQQLYDEGYDGANIDKFYHPDHNGGFVRVRFYTQTGDTKQTVLRDQVRTNILKDMFDTMEQLLEDNVDPSQIMVLLRTNAEAKFLMDTLRKTVSSTNYVQLSQTPFVSSNCFQLQFSPLVNLLVAGVRYIYTEDGAALAYLQQYAPDFEFKSCIHVLRTMTLTDLVELLIQECILSTATPINDLSYVNCFRDMLLSFVANQGSDALTFLRYWDDTMASKTIPAVDVQGIRMMTIHAAKGLEAENVFIPFCDWEMEEDKNGSKLWCHIPELPLPDGQQALLPIPQDSSTSEAGFQSEYDAEHHMMRVDNLNLLYVALTRAAGRLYVYAPVTKNGDISVKKDEIKHTPNPREKWDVGQLMADRCGKWGELVSKFANKQIGGEADYVEYTAGDSNWKPATEAHESDLNPFSFQSAESQESVCHSSASRIEFRQSQDSRNYGWNIASTPVDQLSLEQCALGTICHDILSTIRLYPTVQEAVHAVEQAVDRAYQSGIIPTDKIRQQILPLLTSTVSSLGEYFTGEWFVQCEEAVLLRDEHGEVEERRMDRVMWSKDRTRAIVLDYKFGQDNLKYDCQVRHYMNICSRMGAGSVRGFLWIAAEQRLEEVTL